MTSPRVCLEHVEVDAGQSRLPTDGQPARYDVSELALVTLMLAQARAKADRRRPGGPDAAVGLQHACCSRPDARCAIRASWQARPSACARTSQTTGVWLRGMLHDQFGLDLDCLTWVTFEPSHVDGFEDPPTPAARPPARTWRTCCARARSTRPPGIEPPPTRTCARSCRTRRPSKRTWIRQTGIRPINHTLVVRRPRRAPSRGSRDELASWSRRKARGRHDGPPTDWKPTRPALELLARYAFEQHITPSHADRPEELFPAP